MKVSGIYQIQSQIHPDRVYIGSAVWIDKRWQYHLQNLRRGVHENDRLQNHFNKYGEQDLQFSLVFECDKEVLIHAEQAFIDHYSPYFNICKVAGSCLGIKHSEEAKRNMSAAHIGIKLSEGHKCKMGDGRRGKPRSEEIKRNISIARKGMKFSEEHKHNLSEAHKGKHPSEESKRNMSEGHMGQIPWNKDTPHSNEHKQHLRDAWAKRKLKIVA